MHNTHCMPKQCCALPAPLPPPQCSALALAALLPHAARLAALPALALEPLGHLRPEKEGGAEQQVIHGEPHLVAHCTVHLHHPAGGPGATASRGCSRPPICSPTPAAHPSPTLPDRANSPSPRPLLTPKLLHPT